MDDKLTPESLLTLAAITTARHLSCEELKRHYPRLGSTLLKRVASFACPDDEDSVRAIADITINDTNEWNVSTRHDVKDIQQVGFMVTAVVDNIGVSFTFEKQQITSTSCKSCSTNKPMCSHVIAAITYRIRHSDDILIYASVTEILSALNRDQLQKLIQYSIKEDPASVLGKTFKKIKQVRDAKSAVNINPLPDKTSKTIPNAECTMELTLNELRVSFDSDCRSLRRMNRFPCSYEESIVRANYLYKRYLHRVVDLVQTDQLEAAGQVLITLVTVAGTDDLKIPAYNTYSKQYSFFLKTIERMSSLYMLQCTRETLRQPLITCCLNINKMSKVVPHYSSWAEVPPLSKLFASDSESNPGIMGAKQTSVFYEPLCAAVVPDPNQNFYELLEGKVKPLDSDYNEPLPLMILRFESLRLWDESDRGRLELLRLGVVILWKILRVSHMCSVLTLKEPMDFAKTNFTSKKRKHESDNEESVTANKSPRLSNSINGASSVQDNASTENDIENMKQSTSAGSFGTDDEYVLREVNDLIFNTIKSCQLKNFDSSGTATFLLQTRLESLDKTNLQSDMDTLPVETLSFCLGHICKCMYQVRLFYRHLGDTERRVLALATLRAIEMSRYRIQVDKRYTLSGEEQYALNNSDTDLSDYYGKFIRRMLPPKEITILQTTYMTKLSQCDIGKSCFFNDAVPLPLIAFLVKRELKNYSYMCESNVRARNLCLHMLCHSTKPLAYYAPTLNAWPYSIYSSLYRKWINSYETIMRVFLNHLKDCSDGNLYLTRLLKYFSSLIDEKAMFCLWDELRSFPLIKMSEDSLNALLKFLLHCLEFNDSADRTFKLIHKQDFYVMMKFLCDKLKPKFVGYALENLRGLESLSSVRFLSLLERMKLSMTANTTMSDDMVRSVIRYFSGNWEHTAEISCEVLHLFEPGDDSLGQVFDAILDNESHFTTEALLGTAETNMGYKAEAKGSTTENLYTGFAEKAITLALKRIEQENASVPTRTNRYCDKVLSIFSSNPDSRMRWVFQSLLVDRTDTECQQATVVIRYVLETYKNDISTILYLFECVENHKPLLEKVKFLYGEPMVQLIRKSVFEAIDSVTAAHYQHFIDDLDKVQKNFESYVSDGNGAFRGLLLDVKRQIMSKKQLIKEVKKHFKC